MLRATRMLLEATRSRLIGAVPMLRMLRGSRRHVARSIADGLVAQQLVKNYLFEKVAL